MNGIQLPSDGKNFIIYSSLGKLLGRTYVHSKVKKIVIESYQALEKELPEKVFVYGETGFESGGVFKPHKTHQNGLSVDFMVPVITRDGKSVPLPTSVFNKFGYSIEFDQNSQYENLLIDYEAFAAHLVALHKVATRNKVNYPVPRAQGIKWFKKYYFYYCGKTAGSSLPLNFQRRNLG